MYSPTIQLIYIPKGTRRGNIITERRKTVSRPQTYKELVEASLRVFPELEYDQKISFETDNGVEMRPATIYNEHPSLKWGTWDVERQQIMRRVSQLYVAQGEFKEVHTFPHPSRKTDVLIVNACESRPGGKNHYKHYEIKNHYTRSTKLSEVRKDTAKFYDVPLQSFDLTRNPMANTLRMSRDNLLLLNEDACLGDLFTFQSESAIHGTTPNFGIQWKSERFYEHTKYTM